MTTEPQSQPSNIDGNHEYEAALDTLFAQSGRVLRIFDRALSGAYNVPRRHELLRSFLLANRGARIQIVVHDAANLARDCPRLMNLVRDFSHAIGFNETQAEAKSVYDPFAVIDERHYVHRFHYDHMRAAQGTHDVEGAQLLLDRYAELWEASAPAVSANVSGL